MPRGCLSPALHPSLEQLGCQWVGQKDMLAWRLSVASSNPYVQATVYVYELINEDVKVDKLEFTKPAPAGAL